MQEIWVEGTMYLPMDDNDKVKYVELQYCIKHYDKPSKYGIGKGRISKVELRMDDAVVCSYDRGWSIRPTCGVAEKALKDILHCYDGRDVDADIPYDG